MMFLVFILAEAGPVTTLIKQSDVAELNGVSGRITDREIAEGNYCYFTIKLYILGGITPDRADRSSTPDVCVCVCERERERE